MPPAAKLDLRAAAEGPPDQPCSGPAPPVAGLSPMASRKASRARDRRDLSVPGGTPRMRRRLGIVEPFHHHQPERFPVDAGEPAKGVGDIPHRLPFLLPAGDRGFRQGIRVDDRAARRAACRGRPAWRRMVNSQARRLVPGSNCARAVMARSSVSCTRSSAASLPRVSTRAKRRRRGISAAIAVAKASAPGALSCCIRYRQPPMRVTVRWGGH